ncbi:DinB family protein [Rossellomorea aquimaris]|uniref:DinB family protein n=1 Tax=Rossellomorea aquimaris TaxID=189382 RepID=UPI001CD39370|nr:DinB family protein [Rossellomorea aquimaris]MCA1060265.1 DinB family protein [Rossellomorea aquimaris]
MNFTLHEAIEILERTPVTLETFLSGLSKEWLDCHEGDGTWNAVQVVDHLIEGEKQNWIPRLKMILQEGESMVFPVFDRHSHLKGRDVENLEEKFKEFAALRFENIKELKELLAHYENAFDRTGLHPAFGKVTARQLISTWVVHDLTHLSQVVRVFSKRYGEDVGPWKEYLGVLNQR